MDEKAAVLANLVNKKNPARNANGVDKKPA
jgi:hypothetical protein